MQKSHYRVLILIKHGLYEPYVELAKSAQGKTLLKETPGQSIRIIHYYGVPVGPTIQKLDKFHEKLRWQNRTTNILLRSLDNLLLAPFMIYIPRVIPSKILKLPDEEYQCRVPDTLPTLRWKQLAIYNHVLRNYDFDFIFDTNESSYIDYENLLLQVSRFTGESIYAGNIPFGNFVSGANRFFSRKTLSLLIRKRRYWKPGYLEDLGIGKAMSKLDIPITITESITIPHPEGLKEISPEVLEKNYHFRVKCEDQGRRLDSLTMEGLHEKFKQLRAQA